MNGVNPIICCYDINVVALSKCIDLSDIFSHVFDNALNITVFKFLHTKFATDLTWSLREKCPNTEFLLVHI